MSLLSVYKRPIENVFDLLGQSEDGMTYSLGWAISQNPAFLNRLSTKLRLGGETEQHRIELQRSRSGFGRTDIELISEGNGTVVIEAKRGFVFPTVKQLTKYIDGLTQHPYKKAPLRNITVLTEIPNKIAYQTSKVPKKIKGIEVKFLEWRDVLDLAERSLAEASGNGKQVLIDFIAYLKRGISMTDKQSNRVWVVPLNWKTFDGGTTRFIDVVKKHKKYFHPVGKRYPTTPPNYIAFRYNGKLQTIHYIEDYDVITSFKKEFPDTKGTIIEPHYLYTLGPEITPPHIVKSGKIYASARHYCMLDTLLTCNSVEEAVKESKRRLGEDT